MAITYVSATEDVYNSPTAIGSRTISNLNIGTRTNGLLVVGISLCDPSTPSVIPDVSTVTWNGVTVGSSAPGRVVRTKTVEPPAAYTRSALPAPRLVNPPAVPP